MSKHLKDTGFDLPPVPTPASAPRSNRAALSADITDAAAAPKAAAAKKAHFNAQVDAVLHREFKAAAVRNGQSMTEIVETFMREYIQRS